MKDSTKLDIAEATLMAIRPVGAEYLGVHLYTEDSHWFYRAQVRELGGTTRTGKGPTPAFAVIALIGWYRPDEDARPHDVEYSA